MMKHARLVVHSHGFPQCLILTSDDMEGALDHDFGTVAVYDVGVGGNVLSLHAFSAEGAVHRKARTRQQLVLRDVYHFHISLTVATRVQATGTRTHMLFQAAAASAD